MRTNRAPLVYTKIQASKPYDDIGWLFIWLTELNIFDGILFFEERFANYCVDTLATCVLTVEKIN